MRSYFFWVEKFVVLERFLRNLGTFCVCTKLKRKLSPWKWFLNHNCISNQSAQFFFFHVELSAVWDQEIRFKLRRALIIGIQRLRQYLCTIYYIYSYFFNACCFFQEKISRSEHSFFFFLVVLITREWFFVFMIY